MAIKYSFPWSLTTRLSSKRKPRRSASASASPSASSNLTSRCAPLSSSLTSAMGKRVLRASRRSLITAAFMTGQSPAFSTKILIFPPQASPTRQAVSSATPKLSVLGLPESITSSASVTTAPSTQPPDTEPAKLPSLSTTSWLPTGCGADPQVSMTVAMATLRPSPSQRETCSRIVSVISSSSLRQPSAGCVSILRRICQGLGDFLEALQIVDRAEFIDMRHDRPDPARARLESGIAQKRVEPDHPPRRPSEPRHLVPENRYVVAV